LTRGSAKQPARGHATKREREEKWIDPTCEGEERWIAATREQREGEATNKVRTL
jgi:hypothetical protein